MTYAVAADVQARFNSTELIKITDRANTGALNTTVLGLAIGDASGLMDSWIGRRYVIPIVETVDNPFSEAMTSCCCDITRWMLYVGDRPDEVENRYKFWEAWLNNVAKGIVGLGMTTPPVDILGVSELVSPITETQAPNRIFTSDKLDVY